MSHAANLRSVQRAQQAPSKKRNLSLNGERYPTGDINGVLEGEDPASKISATPVKNAKSSSQKASNPQNSKVGHPDGEIQLAQGEPQSIIISSSSEDSSDDSEGSENDGAEPEHPGPLNDGHPSDQDVEDNKPKVNGVGPEVNHDEGENAEDDNMNDPVTRVDAQQLEGELSFGDLLRRHEGKNMDIVEQYDESADGPNAAILRRRRGQLPPTPSANSLGTVLSQALRTNDAPLLESCLNIGNLQNIRATIERLPSQQAGELLQKLAERMYRRPGRAGTLMVWIQWTVVAHGGYLATSPAAMSHIRELYRTVKMRANALQPLLALKGKLDMLEAQIQLRKARATQTSQDTEQEGIIYIEGESSDDDSSDNGAGTEDPARTKSNLAKSVLDRDLTFDTDEEADDTPKLNGVAESESSDEDNSDDDEDVIDDDAESIDSGDMSDGGVEFEEDDNDADDSEDERPASKKKKTSNH